MNFNALPIAQTANGVIYGGTLEMVSSTTKPSTGASSVQIIQNKLGCAVYVNSTNVSAQAASQWPPPPQLPGVRMVMPATYKIDFTYLILSSPGHVDDVIIPMFKWPHAMKPLSVQSMFSTLTPVQAQSGLVSVGYHLFNVDDSASPIYGTTLAIPVDPASMAKLGLAP